jgi:hypothetical protein
LPGVVKGRACSMQYGSRETSQLHLPHPGMSISQLRCHGNPSARFSSAAPLCASGSLSPAQKKQNGCLYGPMLAIGSNSVTSTRTGTPRNQKQCPSHHSQHQLPHTHQHPVTYYHTNLLLPARGQQALTPLS